MSSPKSLFHSVKKILFVGIILASVGVFFLHFIGNDKKALLPTSTRSVGMTTTQRQALYKAAFDKKNLNNPQNRIMTYAIRTVTCVVTGELCTDNPADSAQNNRNSIMGVLTQGIIYPYTHPPASGIGWIANGLQNAGFAPKTYAAEGVGFSVLTPYENLWKIFRDISYMLLVFVLIAIGFMIMFRMKLNAQTVISVESALPRIVIALLVITFSFAIAGFLIDLMYVLIALIISLLSNNNAFYDAGKFQNEYLSAPFWKITGAFFPTKNDTFFIGGMGFLMTLGNQMLNFLGSGINATVRAISAILLVVFGTTHVTTALGFIGDGVGKIFSITPFAGPAEILVDSIVGLAVPPALFGLGFAVVPEFIIGVLIFMTMLLVSFRIFFLLLRSYLQVLLLVIFAPVILLMEAIPGKSTFSFWLKSLIGELITFPVVITIFLIAYIIVNTSPASVTNLWTPPFLGGLDPTAFTMILGMGLLFIIPDLLKLFKEQFLGIKGLPVGINLGSFFSGGTTALSGGMGLVGGYGSIGLALPGLKEAVANNFSAKSMLGKILGSTKQ